MPAAFRRDRAAHRGRPDARGARRRCWRAGRPTVQADLADARRAARREQRWPRGSRSCASSACALGADSRRLRQAVVAALYRALDLPAGATPETVLRGGLRRSRDRPASACSPPAARWTCGSDRGWRALRPDHGLAARPTRPAHRAASATTRPSSCAPATGQPKAAEQRHHRPGGDARGGRGAAGRAGAPAAAWAEQAKAAAIAERTAALLRVGVGGARALCAAQGAACRRSTTTT